MYEFFKNVLTKESAFRALLVLVGAAVMQEQPGFLGEYAGLAGAGLMAVGTGISSGDKTRKVLNSELERIEKIALGKS